MPSFVDLNRSDASSGNAACDICIIGAGAAGLYLASRLWRKGVDVILLDAGGRTSTAGAKVGINARFTASQYRGATDGRFFGWGGSTARWGGLLAPHSELDLRNEDSAEAVAWRHIVKLVEAHTSAVRSVLELSGEPDFFEYPRKRLEAFATMLCGNGLHVVASEFLPLQRRNLTYLLARERTRQVRVYLNAAVCRWRISETAEGGSISNVEARSLSGRSVSISAQRFVVAAGGIESARILLEVSRSTEERMIPRSAAIGRYLGDHLSCPIAKVADVDRETAARVFGPSFSERRLRSFRFIERTRDGGVPRHFAHFIFDIQNAGFELAKAVLQTIQSRGSARFRPRDVVAGVYGLSRLAVERYVRSRLYIPPNTSAHLQLDIEQEPKSENRVYLGDEEDGYGRRVAVVNWSIGSGDQERICATACRFLAKWPVHRVGLPRLNAILSDEAESKPYDAYHPVGTCRLGTDDQATVDLDLRVKGTSNLYVLSTGVFPSAGTANPTFSMLCLGEELAKHLSGSV